jgi:hypothetical protein
MNVTADVINDLLPVYLAGEASQDTRALIGEYLRSHPDVAEKLKAQAAKAAAALDTLTPSREDLREKATLERIRRFNRHRMHLLGFSIAYTLVPFAVVGGGDGIRWLMLRDDPKMAVYFWIAALGCWLGYFLMGRRLRAGTAC